jgi:hypothetical protein
LPNFTAELNYVRILDAKIIVSRYAIGPNISHSLSVQ